MIQLRPIYVICMREFIKFFREKSRDCTCPPEWPICQCGGRAALRLVTGKPVTASGAEVSLNPASRSAKLRVAQKPVRGDG